MSMCDAIRITDKHDKEKRKMFICSREMDHRGKHRYDNELPIN
jgi:hypothetical protein